MYVKSTSSACLLLALLLFIYPTTDPLAANPSCLLTCGFGDVFATDVDDSYRPSAPGNPEALPPPPHTITQPLSALESRCADFLLDPVTGDALITPSECAERALAHRQRAKVIMYRVSGN